ncbi:MAG: right-handed parallel beta-helix repeat-containing protein [Planctomycetota bacterium]|jgi:hypothetical protein
MKKDRLNQLKLGFALLGIFLCTSTEGKIWHVAQKNLPDIGTENQVRSIGEAVSRLAAGDTLIIHGGVYREQVNVEQSGTPEKPITIQAGIGEYVVVTGADRITQWQKVDGDDSIFFTDWPHRFVTWNEYNTHPSDDYHKLIGRCEQVFVNGYQHKQVLEKQKLSRGTFFVDLNTKRLYVWDSANRDISSKKVMVEASVLSTIWACKASHVRTKGIRFRYAANRAQHGAVQFSGDDNEVEDCTFEYSNACGVKFTGERIKVRNCVFQYNGQLGFSAGRAHGLLLTDCVVTNNNTKGFNRGWEAGGNKIVLTRDAIIENSIFTENRGDGIWFDIGNEKCEVRNCFISNNENAGIFYEISYSLHAHDNVIVGNGFAFTPSAWGANAGISISSSPYCRVERNFLIGNKEGLSLREQKRSTPLIEGGSEPIWNHSQSVRNNVFAYNRDAQVWGWFDIDDERHWPKSMQEGSANKLGQNDSNSTKGLPAGSALADLKLNFRDNIYNPGPGQGFFNWGVTWKRHKRYLDLETINRELSFGHGSRIIDIGIKDFHKLDLRVSMDSPTIQMQCYPKGNVPGAQLGTQSQ